MESILNLVKKGLVWPNVVNGELKSMESKFFILGLKMNFDVTRPYPFVHVRRAALHRLNMVACIRHALAGGFFKKCTEIRKSSKLAFV